MVCYKPNTQDYNEGTVTSIKITSFPANVTSIMIDTTTYYATAGDIPGICPSAACQVWPAAGVTVPYTPGAGPNQVISVDPVNGMAMVVVPFVAIDDAGKEDATAGSITLSYTGILPVQIISFTAQPNSNNSVRLAWEAGTEINVHMYQVEYSADGINYIGTGIQAATGNRYYGFLHTSPKKGLNFYRLKIIDNDGRISYSEIRKVNFGLSATTVKIYPNPTSDIVNVTVGTDFINKAAVISIFSVDGKLVYQKNIKALSQTETIPVTNLAGGKYFIRLICDTGVINGSFRVIP
jgi:hypothetical protein